MILVAACFAIESHYVTRQQDVRVVRTAIGEASRDTLDRLSPKATDTSLLISTGFCGGIRKDIRRGNLFLARSIHHLGEEIRIDPEILDRAYNALNQHCGNIHVGICASVDHVLPPGEKQALANGEVIAADMESGPLARWAAARGVPFLVLRVVLDTVEERLPFPIDRPFWISAMRHPIVAARTGHNALAASRILGTAVNDTARAFLGRSDA